MPLADAATTSCPRATTSNFKARVACLEQCLGDGYCIEPSAPLAPRVGNIEKALHGDDPFPKGYALAPRISDLESLMCKLGRQICCLEEDLWGAGAVNSSVLPGLSARLNHVEGEFQTCVNGGFSTGLVYRAQTAGDAMADVTFRVICLEEEMLGRRGAGAILPRLCALERTLIGCPSTGHVIERIALLEEEVGTPHGALRGRVSALERNVRGRSPVIALLPRIVALERDVGGRALGGALIKRVEGLEKEVNGRRGADRQASDGRGAMVPRVAKLEAYARDHGILLLPSGTCIG